MSTTSTSPVPRRQFIIVKYSPRSARAYTYHNDGVAVKAGDEVLVPNLQGDYVRVAVVDVHYSAPTFITKAIKHVEGTSAVDGDSGRGT